MNSYKKLFNNSIIFAIGNLGSKIFTILLVPLYTYTLTTSEYGLMDLAVTTVNLIVPIISVSIHEGILRYSMTEDEHSESVLNSGIFVNIISTLILLFILTVMAIMNNLSLVIFYSTLIAILQMFRMSFGSYLRAIGEVKLFAMNGIILTFILALSNFLFLFIFNWGLQGFFISFLSSEFISNVFMIVKGNITKRISPKQIDYGKTKTMIKYSIPLIPNSIMWWLINASNRYFIVAMIGLEANALFSVASKIPSLLTIITTIFFQAWQLSAIEDYEKKRNSDFYSNIFNYFVSSLILIASIIIIFIRPIISLVVESSYQESWQYVPIQLIAIIFSSISSFLGASYIASKQTKGVLTTSIAGGLTSFVSNYLFIRMFGLYGPALASTLSFAVMSIIRFIEVNKKSKINLKYKNYICISLLVVFQIIIVHIFNNILIGILFNLLIYLVILFILRDQIKSLLSLFKKES